MSQQHMEKTTDKAAEPPVKARRGDWFLEKFHACATEGEYMALLGELTDEELVHGANILAQAMQESRGSVNRIYVAYWETLLMEEIRRRTVSYENGGPSVKN